MGSSFAGFASGPRSTVVTTRSSWRTLPNSTRKETRMEERKARKWYLRGNLYLALDFNYLVTMNLRPVILSFLCCCCSVTKPCPTLQPQEQQACQAHLSSIVSQSLTVYGILMEWFAFPSSSGPVLSEPFTMTHPSRVALHCMAHRFIELCTPFTMTRLWSLKGICFTMNFSLLSLSF